MQQDDRDISDPTKYLNSWYQVGGVMFVRMNIYISTIIRVGTTKFVDFMCYNKLDWYRLFLNFKNDPF